MSTTTTRRGILTGLASLAALTLAGCATAPGDRSAFFTEQMEPSTPEPAELMYAAMPNERFPIPAVPLRLLDERYYRQLVDDPTGERPGTVIVDTADRFLYLVMQDNKAMRYGVGIGRDGFSWSGRATIAYKRQWPTWTPPAEMIAREPELEQWRNGMPPGLLNPLGARALYIFQNGQDTLYRLHGNPEVQSIGRAVSSGCVRLLNQDVIDLYGRVPNGSPIVVV